MHRKGAIRVECNKHDTEECKVWKKIITIRNENRFNSMNVLNSVFNSFYELHGDRLYGDDRAIIGGLAFLDDRSVTVIAQYKGSNPKERDESNYGMPLPEGYRKAIRLMKQAEKFDRPIINIIDTPGAYPGIEAEKRGQAEAIARSLYEMSRIRVPIISIITGEGGSGGALAMAVANKIIMLENSIFSVVSPEGCASILWRDKNLAPQAAENLRITAQDLYSLGIIDEIISEKESFDHMCIDLKNTIGRLLKEQENKMRDAIQAERFKKFRSIGKIL